MPAKNSDAKLRANHKYDAKAYEFITFRERKEASLHAHLSKAAADAGVSKNQYILSAVYAKLRADKAIPGHE